MWWELKMCCWCRYSLRTDKYLLAGSIDKFGGQKRKENGFAETNVSMKMIMIDQNSCDLKCLVAYMWSIWIKERPTWSEKVNTSSQGQIPKDQVIHYWVDLVSFYLRLKMYAFNVIDHLQVYIHIQHGTRWFSSSI